jgi:hypothetical protein
MKSSAKWAVALSVTASAVLVACGGGGGLDVQDTSAKAAPAVITGTINTSTTVANSPLAALSGQSLVFSGGISEFGTTSDTTVAVNTTDSSFNVKDATSEATGDFSLGSCVFLVKTVLRGSKFTVGQKVTITPCEVKLATTGILANGKPQTTTASLIFGTKPSQSKTVNITVSPTGEVSVGNTKYPTVVLVPVTGGL